MRAILLASLALLVSPAWAANGIYLCVGENQRMSIQDKPCGAGMRTKSYLPDAPRHSGGNVTPKERIASAVANTSTVKEPKLQRNKGVICGLLNTEKTEALAQINGSLAPAVGEDPKNNLAKIEKQRARVGCDVE
jgi:hypothetical protein